MVRAKFKVRSIARDTQSVPDGVDENGRQKWKNGEVRTIILHPVYGGGDPNHENIKFWHASPSGEIKLGCANLAAAEAFELDQEFYVDFTPVEQPSVQE